MKIMLIKKSDIIVHNIPMIAILDYFQCLFDMGELMNHLERLT